MKLTQCELILYKVSGEAQNYYKVQCERYKSIKKYAFILHDKDKNLDGTPKKPHIHLLLHFGTAFDTDNLLKWFQHVDLKDNQIKELDLPFKVNNFNTSIPFNSLKSSDLSNEAYEGQATPLLVYEGTTTKLFLGFDNFHVITKYNRSSFYALAIHQLAMAISDKFDD